MNNESDILVERYLDRSLTPAEGDELDRQLRAEPALRRELLQAAGMEVELRRTMRVQTAWRLRRFWQRTVPLGVAALLLLQVGGWLWVSRVGATRSTGRQAVVDRALPSVQGKVVALRGEASVTRGQAGDVWQPVVSGMVLRVGDRLQVGSNTVAVFRYGDGSQLRMYALSDLTLAASNGAKRVWLQAGALDAVIAPQPPDHPMEVDTPGLATIVRGTEFRMLADSQSVWLGVRHGKVDVVRASDRRVVAVTDGYYVATAKGWPFQPLSTICPYWQAQCVARTGAQYR
jgi:ferric-dicitrate binding protein FerR (iron transport regulator)